MVRTALDLDLVAVSKRYGAALAVNTVSRLFTGGIGACLPGRSGCGTTFTLWMIAGHESVSDGAITLAGKDIVALPPAQRGTAMMFRNHALFPHMSVLDNVAAACDFAQTLVRLQRSAP